MRFAAGIMVVIGLAAAGILGEAADATEEAGEAGVSVREDVEVAEGSRLPDSLEGVAKATDRPAGRVERSLSRKDAEAGAETATPEPESSSAAQANGLVLLAIGTLGLCYLRRRHPSER